MPFVTKKIFVLVLGTCVLLHAGCQNAGKQRQSRIPTSADTLTTELSAIAHSGIIKGFSVAIVDTSGVRYAKGFGFSDLSAGRVYTDTTIQNIASISKTLIGIALLKAQELGMLDFNDPINKYLPFKVENPRFPGLPIAIRQLTTHTSGITDNKYYFQKDYFMMPGASAPREEQQMPEGIPFNQIDTTITLGRFLQNLLTTGGRWYTNESYANSKPGEKFEYSNTGATLAAYIVEIASKQSFAAFTRHYILQPLHMQSSGWNRNEVDQRNFSKLYHSSSSALPAYGMVSYPDGNLITSASDLAKFLTELINGFRGKGRLLTNESYNGYFRGNLQPHNFTHRNTTDPFNDEYDMGSFIAISPAGYYGHTGGDPGVNTMMFFDPKTSKGAIMIGNTSFSGKQGDSTYNIIWANLWKNKERF